MKFEKSVPPDPDLDETDLRILELLQRNCKQPLAEIGKHVGMTAPSVVERIHKLEGAGVILDYVARVDARAVGKDVTAFIGVSLAHPRGLKALEKDIEQTDDVLECHHVTGEHTLMLKAKTANTETLERLIDQIRSWEGVTRTETMVVLSTHTERSRIALDTADATPRRGRRPGGRGRRGRAGVLHESEGSGR